MEIRVSCNKKYFISQNIIKAKDYYWMVSSTTNVIWKCDLLFNIVDYYILEEEAIMADLFRAVVCVDEIIYLFPFNAKNAYKFDLNKNKIEKIDIDLLDNETKCRKFSYAFVIKDLIIAVGRNIGGFLKYDLNKGTATLVTKGWPFKEDYICSFTNCVKGKRAYIVSVIDASIIEFDFINNDIICHDFSRYCSNNLTAITSDDEYIYITNDQSEIIRLDDRLKILDCRKLEGWNDKNIRLVGIEKQNYWYIGNTLGKILIETEGITKQFCFKVDLNGEYGYCFTAVELFDKKLLLQSRNDAEILFFDFEKELIDRINIIISNELLDKYLYDLMNIVFKRRELIEEDSVLNLKKYLELI